VDTEAGINRVFLRTTRTAGTITARATSSGLTTHLPASY
jgi:beta-galactosidase